MKIFVTGGIGSGKTTVCNMLVEHWPGMKYFSVDKLVADLYTRSDIQQQLWRLFNTCDRQKISAMAFENASIRITVENIFVQSLQEQIYFVTTHLDDFVFEFPLLTEFGNKYLQKADYVIGVECLITTRIQRVMTRDNKTEEQVKQIIGTQATDAQREAICDYIVTNEVPFLEENLNMIVEAIRENRRKRNVVT